MSITISFDGSKVKLESQFDNYDKPALLNANEEKAIGYIKDEFLKKGINFDEIQFRRRSQSYLTLLSPNNFDFCRIKVGIKSVWFSILTKPLSEKIKADHRFDSVKNRQTLHWKIKLESIDDFKNNSDLIVESYIVISSLY